MNPGELIFILVIATTCGGDAGGGFIRFPHLCHVGAGHRHVRHRGPLYLPECPFLAMMQILIYVGAISILIAFAVMLVGPLYRKPKEWTTLGKFAAALAVALLSLYCWQSDHRGPFRTASGAKPLVVTTKETGQGIFGQAHPAL